MACNLDPHPLPVALQARAEQFYETDLSSVRLRLFDAASDRHVLACARGDEIYLHVRALAFPAPALFELLGHELAHVVQQRQGRVPLAADPQTPVDDLTLEHEAIRAGRRFAARLPSSGFPGTTRHRVRRPAIQCAVAVGGQAIESASALAEKSRRILALIPSGLEWLTWAIADPSDVYGFADESSLVHAIQSGLHGDEPLLLRVPSLQVSVRRLLELRLEELSLIEALELQRGGNKAVDVKTKRMLAANDLWTQADLAVGHDFVGDDLEPVFQSLSLADQVRLFDLVEGSSTEAGLDAGIQGEAKAFALERAVAPSEFVDFYRFYIAVADGAGFGKKGTARRGKLAGELITALEPHLYGLLKCPYAAEELTPTAMMRMVREWLGLGKVLGFPRVSHGLCEVIRYGGADTLDPKAAEASVASYVEGMRTLLLTGEPSSSELSQDGLTRIFRVDSDSAHGEVAHREHLALLTIERLQKHNSTEQGDDHDNHRSK